MDFYFCCWFVKNPKKKRFIIDFDIFDEISGVLKSYLVICFFLSIHISSFAQGEANNWYFGNNAGITFNTNPPSALIDGELQTQEGCSSISDVGGNLLMYTDGRSIWDRAHNIMPNANYFEGTGLLGDSASTQSGLIVPHPLESDIFYVFTVDEPHHENAFAYPNQGPADPDGTALQNYQDIPSHYVPMDDDGFNNGLNYSIVDMSLRDGYGDVVENQRNIHLITYNENDPEEIKFKSSEKITAVIGSDCNSVWVITHFVDKFYAFLIDEDGVNHEPIVSQVDPVTPISGYRMASKGQLKISPNGQMLLAATYTTNFDQITHLNEGDGHVYLYDFDNATGEITNPRQLISNVQAYGVEFSSDSKKVYASYLTGFDDGFINPDEQPINTEDQVVIRQWMLDENDNQTSFYDIPDIDLTEPSGLQLGPDGRIYVAVPNTDKLDMIANPNSFGVNLAYVKEAINLQGKNSALGLPPYIQSIFESRVDIVNADNADPFAIQTDLNLCVGDTYTIGTEYNLPAEFKWYLNNELLEDENESSITIEVDESHLGQEKNYVLEIFPMDGVCRITGSANVFVNNPPDYNNVYLSKCYVPNHTISIFDLSTVTSEIINGVDDVTEEEIQLTFYNTFLNAQNRQNQIENFLGYEPIENNEIIYAVVDNFFGCSVVVEIELTSIQATTHYSFIETCDVAEDGFSLFNMYDIELPDNISTENVTFHSSIEDALNNVNPIDSPQTFLNNNAYQDKLYYHANDGSECGKIGIIELIVNRIPEVSNDQTFFYCIDTYPNTIPVYSSLHHLTDRYDFLWLNSNVTSPEIYVNEGGYHPILITDKLTGCENIEEVFVETSNRASYTVLIDEGSVDNNRLFIQVNPGSIGYYEYALNNVNGPYQESPIFDNLAPGDYRIFVKDKRGCGITTSEISIIGAMKFFTPNGDGINDTWRIKGLANSNNRNANVNVFDRYGRLLIRFKASGSGWDGTFKGKPMPENDYWYSIELNSGKIVKGNFSLIRGNR